MIGKRPLILMLMSLPASLWILMYAVVTCYGSPPWWIFGLDNISLELLIVAANPKMQQEAERLRRQAE